MSGTQQKSAVRDVYDTSVYSTVLPRPTAVTPARRAEQQREALEAVTRVRQLHRSVPVKRGAGRVCACDGGEYPCPTILALAPASAEPQR